MGFADIRVNDFVDTIRLSSTGNGNTGIWEVAQLVALIQWPGIAGDDK
jgi:hypothetical protein